MCQKRSRFPNNFSQAFIILLFLLLMKWNFPNVNEVKDTEDMYTDLLNYWACHSSLTYLHIYSIVYDNFYQHPLINAFFQVQYYT